ncbi:Arc family DNA-binding protein [Vibrio diazotrophicus]|uniref:Arc family DNA-binding protein n=1 Tax=Vibrio diazotrophicus TaxID=685 RepID=UPI0022AF6575|nr:Arc family DNA-binding protein [Vibrio diazotrophicus]MCZ4371173.1 Arc family DNA-binding protein [Vibrio diazotrophicus]
MTSRPSSYPLRMPIEMREQLESQAEKNRRSLQQELLGRVQLSLDLEAILKEQVGSLEELTTKVPELIFAQRRTQRLQTEVEELKKEVSKYQQLYMKQVQENSPGLEGKERNIQRLKSDLSKCLSELERLFPSNI